MPHFRSLALPLFALTLVAGPALAAQGEQTLLVAPDGQPGDQFGFAVDSSESWVLVGAPRVDDQGGNSGAAYLYEVGTGKFSRKLQPTVGGAGALFGHTVSVDGDYAIVGAPLFDATSNNEGKVYVFDVNTGAEILVLDSPQPQNGRRFGSGVAIEGDLALVGASEHRTSTGAPEGCAYVYRVSTGELLTHLVTEDATPFDYAGDKVSLSNGIAAVGAFGVGSFQGAVYLFDALTGQQLYKLPNPSLDPSEQSRFGRALAIDGPTLIVGAPEADGAFASSGTAFLYDVASGSLLGQIFAEDDQILHWFGYSVDLRGSTALIGSYLDDDGGDNAGAAYLFDLRTGQQISKILPQPSDANDHFGSSVNLGPCGAFVAGTGYSGGGPQVGGAYLVSLCSPLGVAFCDPVPNSTGVGGTLLAEGSAQVQTNDLVLVADQLPLNQFGYLLNGASTILPAGVGSGNLCLGGGLGRHVTSLANSGAAGRIETSLDLAALPRPAGGAIAVQPGDTWHFQLWHRDGLTSNLTEGLSLTFL